MKNLKNPTTFILGLTISFLATVVAWYWYKSTSAEDGALDLLDRLAQTDARLREVQASLTHSDEMTMPYISLTPNGKPAREKEEIMKAERTTAVIPDELERIKGVGPIFATRLHNAGIHTITQLTEQTPAHLAAILNVHEWRAEDILAEARKLG
jgi:predicted flap endonuclease-1-like 5' DNA nuclease